MKSIRILISIILSNPLLRILPVLESPILWMSFIIPSVKYVRRHLQFHTSTNLFGTLCIGICTRQVCLFTGQMYTSCCPQESGDGCGGGGARISLLIPATVCVLMAQKRKKEKREKKRKKKKKEKKEKREKKQEKRKKKTKTETKKRNREKKGIKEE